MQPSLSLGRASLRRVPSEGYVCASCLLQQGNGRVALPLATKIAHRRPQSNTTNDRIHHLSRRMQTTAKASRASSRLSSQRRGYAHDSLASSTAINAPTSIPPELRELHQRLQQLQDKASSFVNLSQIQLILRSLEAEDPVVRIAFLGVGKNGQRAANQLARVLLSDVLEDEQTWEKILREPEDGRSILLRYGEANDESGVQYNAPLVRTLNVPSPLLQRLNLEIMVTALHSGGAKVEQAAELEETILVPPLTIANSSAGRVGFVRHPVHKALLIAEGVSGAVEFGRLPVGLADGELVGAALSVPLRSASGAVSPEEDGTSHAIDIDLASHAIGLFRENKANGALFNREWQTSRMPAITAWLKQASSSTHADTALKPAIQTLLEKVFTNAEKAIDLNESAAAQAEQAQQIPQSQRAQLRDALSTWSADAHRDLQRNLDRAFESLPWRKTSWWRLFWRIDEVSISASDVVIRGWLIESEQTLAFLAGRFLQTGIASPSDLKCLTSSSPSSPESANFNEVLSKVRNSIVNPTPSQSSNIAQRIQAAATLAQVEEQSGIDVLFDPPWPQAIRIARQQLLHERIPALHRKAQALLMKCLSTIGVTSGLAGTLLVATSGVAVYESGAIAALGLVWALRRLQNKWGGEREAFAKGIQDDGRTVLIDVEKRLEKLVEEGGRTTTDLSYWKEWDAARLAIRECREAVEKVMGEKEVEVEVKKQHGASL